MQFQLASAVVLAALLSAGSAQGAVMVVGDGPEHSCYLVAKFGYYTMDSLRHCNDALTNRDLILPDRAATYVNRGVILQGLGRTEAAMSDYNSCLRMMPEQADAYVNRGAAYIALKQYATALIDIEKGLSLNPTDLAVAYFDRAVALEELGRLSEAYRDYQRSAAENPDFAPARESVARFRVITRQRST